MTVFWTKFRGPGAVQFSAPDAKLAGGKATTTATLQRAGRLHPAGGGRRRVGRVGRQLRLSLLLDQHAGQGHGERRQRPCHQSAFSNRQSAISNLHQRRRADFPEELPDLPSPGHIGADVAGHLRRSAPVGAVDPATRREPRHAAVASRQDGWHPPLQERSIAQRRRDRDRRAMGRHRRAAGQSGRHAGAARRSARKATGSSASPI